LARLKAELAQLAEGSNVQLQSLKCGTAATPPPIDASAELRAQVRTLHFCSSMQRCVVLLPPQPAVHALVHPCTSSGH
jgi:hypothetical protein